MNSKDCFVGYERLIEAVSGGAIEEEIYKDAVKAKIPVLIPSDMEEDDLPLTEENFDDTTKEAVLYAALKDGNLTKAHEMLRRGATHEDAFYLVLPIFDRTQADMIKLLVQFGASVNRSMAMQIFKEENVEFSKELVSYIMKYSKNIQVVASIFFCELLRSEFYTGALAEGIIDVLLDQGFRVHEHSIHDDDEAAYHKDGLTPLQMAVKKMRIDVVSLLLQKLGGDVTLNAARVRDCLSLAVETGMEKMLLLLLENDRERRKAKLSLEHPLTVALSSNKLEMVYILLKHGVNMKASRRSVEILRKIRNPSVDYKILMIKELAKLQFENQPISPENLNYLEENANDNRKLKDIFNECVDELEKLKNHKIHKNITL